MKKTVSLLAVLLSVILGAAEYPVSNVKISVSSKKYTFAAAELKKHLELTGNKLAPGAGALQVLIGTPGEKAALQPGEVRWLYKDGKLYLWGNERTNRSGTEFAVYEFLDKKMGVRWLYPGDTGIVVPPCKTISFKEGESGKWVPPLLWAYVRGYRWDIRGFEQVNYAAPPALRVDKKQWLANGEDNRIFLLRHRHVTVQAIRYAHAYVKWPKRFAKTHMDYFGVSPYGKPQIPANPRYAKLCLSNPAVIDQIIADYKVSKNKKYINLSPNDGTPGFCHCSKCMALDTRKPGESFYDHLTDRYLNFWNRVIKRVKEINPDVMAATYVYSYYRFPPRREKIEYPDNMLCGLVPQLGEDSRSLFEAWKKVGMKHCFLRPNDLCYHSAELRFMEKRIYDKYQETRKHFKLWGADYDASLGTSSIDMESYVASRMLSFPDKSFDEIAAEYYSGFGKAAALVQNVYETLRPMGEAMYMHSYRMRRRTMLDDSELDNHSNSAYVNAQKAQLKRLEEFDVTQLDPASKLRFEKFKLVLEHSILASEFIEQSQLHIAEKKNNFPAAAKALLDFRCGKGKVLNEKWGSFFRRQEKNYWTRYQPYRDATSNDMAKLSDIAAGWRNSFDAPAMQEWRPRNGFLRITNAEASFDRYSIQTKPVQKNTVVMNRSGIEVTPGAEYSLSFDVKAPKGGKFRMRVMAGGKALKNISVNGGTATWQQGSAKFTVPADAGKLVLYLYISDAPEGGFIDNIVLTRLKK